QKLLERTTSAVCGCHISELFLDRLPSLESPSAQGEVRGLTPSGGEKTFGVTVTALAVPEQGTVGYVYTFDDRTELRRLEREIRMRERLAAGGPVGAGNAGEDPNPPASHAGALDSTASP